MTINAPKVAEILGGQQTLHRRVRTLADLREVVTGGLPVSALEAAVHYISEDPQVAGALRDRIVPRAARNRRERLKPVESERLERLARIMALAEEVWESKEDAQEFLTTPQPMLDDLTPLDLAQSELGARQVEDLLMQLEYSLPV